MDILNGDEFYRHSIFYRLLPIDLHGFYHYYHFKVLNALSPFTIFTVYCCMKCVECITALLLCIEYYTCFVRNDEIKMSNPLNGNIFRVVSICAGSSPVHGEFPAQWHGALMFSLMCARINRCVNNREASDLRRYYELWNISEYYINAENQNKQIHLCATWVLIRIPIVLRYW